MKTFVVIGLSALMMLAAGCGVNKQFVADEIAASEARTAAEISTVKDATNTNQAEITRLTRLATELSEKTDLAIDKASGFENYQVIWSGEITFGFDSYEINDVAASILDEAGMKMEQVPGSLMELVGHTDRTGSATYNLLLGEKRANSAKRYLTDKFGVSLYRLFTNSYGKEKPVAAADDRNASSKNRRVQIQIWGPGM
jgi:peptidoglycan-associated lipoprotein